MKSHILSTSDCVQILAQKCGTQNFKILSTSIAPLSEDVNGFLGEHLRAKFVILLRGKETIVQFFIKQLTDNQESAARQIAIESGAYLKEAFVFEHLIGADNHVPWAPKFHLFKDNNTLVLDDVSVDGFTLPVLGLEQFDLDHCKLVLNTLAAFHAHCFALEDRRSMEMGRPYFLNEEFPDKFKDVLFSKCGTVSELWVKASLVSIEHLIDVIPESDCLSPEKFKVKVRNLFEQVYEAIQPSKRFRNVVCHADLWFKNLLFRYVDGQPKQCLLVDFQLLRYCVPAHDVIMFLQINTTRAFRKQHMETLLRFYHSKLGNELQQRGMDVEDVLPWEDFDASLPFQIKIWKLIGVIYKSWHLLGEDFFRETMKDTDMYYQFMFVNRHGPTLREYKENPVFRAKIIDLMTELRETLQEPNISREDCYKILSKKLNGDDFDLEKYSTTSASSKRMGYLGDHKILHMSVLHKGERKNFNFFAKFTPSVVDQLTFVMHTGGFTKEIFLYDILHEQMKEMGVTQISEVTPMHYMTRKNDCLIVENLARKKYKPLNKYQKCTYEEINCVVIALAKYHAASLIFEEKMSVQTGNTFRISDEYAKYIQEPYYVDYEDKIMNGLLKSCVNGLILEVELLLDPHVVSFGEMRRKITKICDKFTMYVKPSSKYRNVVSHGDLWANNIMILRDDGGKPVRSIFVDFQTCRYTAPSNDLMSFLYFNTTQSFRDQYERKILEKYHSLLCDELLSEGLDADVIVPFADFIESCESNRLFAAAQAAMFDQYILMNDDFFTVLYNDPVRQAQIINGDRSYIITENCTNDKRYRSMLTQSITTLCDLCQTWKG